ncbi:MAG: SapC family protein [Pseudomonadota bacterium]
MTTLSVLDVSEHHATRVAMDFGPAFGDAVNQTRVFASELPLVQRDYPIFFRQDESGAFISVALLGLERDENLYLDLWRTEQVYIPALHRRGPFSIGVRAAQVDGGAPEHIIQIDTADARVGASNGQALFLDHGGHSPFLQSMTDCLRTIGDGLTLDTSFHQVLLEHDLLESVTIDLQVSETENVSIPDVFAINQDKFLALAPAALKELQSNGTLSLIYAALFSLSNTSRLLSLKYAGGAH